MIAFKALAISFFLGLAAANECPALSHTFGYKPKNIFDLETVDCRVGIQAAECAINVRPSYGQTWAAFRINRQKSCNHGAPYGDCCCFSGDPPVGQDNLEENEDVLLFYWTTEDAGNKPGPGTGCIQDPTNGCCGRQDIGHFTTTGGCPYPRGDLADQFGRIGDGCDKEGGPSSEDPNIDKQPGTKSKSTDPDSGGGTSTTPQTTTSSRGRFFSLFRRLAMTAVEDPNAHLDPHSNFKSKSKRDDDETGDKDKDKDKDKTKDKDQDKDKNKDKDQDKDKDKNKNKGGSSTDPNTKSGGSGTGGPGTGGSGSGPKCGPLGKFPSSPGSECKKDPMVKCKPGVKILPPGGKTGSQDTGGASDSSSSTCPGSQTGTTGGGGGKSGTTGGTTSSNPDSTTNNKQKRWPNLGGNQFDPYNKGQLSPKGTCCWCHEEKSKKL